ncbi:hypothetical protein HDU98_000714, partial [Podochytrium sp. JEL0797]
NVKEESEKSSMVANLCKSLGGVRVLLKGAEDLVSTGQTSFGINERGSPRRCGGQGDILSGTVAAFVSWMQSFENGVYSKEKKEPQAIEINLSESGDTVALEPEDLACASACLLVKRTARRAFDVKGRAMSATGMVECLGQVFSETFDEMEFKKRN